MVGGDRGEAGEVVGGDRGEYEEVAGGDMRGMGW